MESRGSQQTETSAAAANTATVFDTQTQRVNRHPVNKFTRLTYYTMS